MAALGAGDRKFSFFTGEAQRRPAVWAFVVGMGSDFPQLFAAVTKRTFEWAKHS